MLKNVSVVRGFSLIEMLLFIVVIGIAATAMMVPFSTTLGLKAPTSNYQTTAMELAQQRMELILGNRRLNGYPATGTLADPCVALPAIAVCVDPSGYSVDSTITASTSINGDANYTLITVAVTGSGTATLKALVGKY